MTVWPEASWAAEQRASSSEWDQIDAHVIPWEDLGVRVTKRARRNPQTGKLVDFAVMLDAEQDGAFVEVLRIDCCHGYVHTHHGGKDHDTDLVPADCRESLDRAYRWAQTCAWDLDRWVGGLL